MTIIDTVEMKLTIAGYLSWLAGRLVDRLATTSEAIRILYFQEKKLSYTRELNPGPLKNQI